MAESNCVQTSRMPEIHCERPCTRYEDQDMRTSDAYKTNNLPFRFDHPSKWNYGNCVFNASDGVLENTVSHLKLINVFLIRNENIYCFGPRMPNMVRNLRVSIPCLLLTIQEITSIGNIYQVSVCIGIEDSTLPLIVLELKIECCLL
ncbi:hypothetical protein CDAR_466781 [Caerostris darwini]|uniref:Uncharacterized protein n=1 Tax=Caerostris darwini TaxID=1538125 RepID=A0AAV4UHR2_9ARAC|nr:hypothetical protein CDAR_466781 [Caerostris darwini]